MSSIVVIGVGNILFKDEGVGVYASRYLEENFCFDPPIDIVDGGTLGLNLMNYYLSYDKVLIIDTLSIDDTPGSVYHIPADELIGLGNYRKTAHEVEVVAMVEICSLLGNMAEVSVMGIVPEDIKSIGIALSRSIEDRFDTLIADVLSELKKANINVIANDTPKTLLEIIRHYSGMASAV